MAATATSDLDNALKALNALKGKQLTSSELRKLSAALDVSVSKQPEISLLQGRPPRGTCAKVLARLSGKDAHYISRIHLTPGGPPPIFKGEVESFGLPVIPLGFKYGKVVTSEYWREKVGLIVINAILVFGDMLSDIYMCYALQTDERYEFARCGFNKYENENKYYHNKNEPPCLLYRVKQAYFAFTAISCFCGSSRLSLRPLTDLLVLCRLLHHARAPFLPSWLPGWPAPSTCPTG